MAKRMFSNGTEYEIFLDNYCYNCRLYVPAEQCFEETDNELDPNCCPIKLALNTARFDGGKCFPDSFVNYGKGIFMKCTAFSEGEHPMFSEQNTIAEFWRFNKS